jgi:transcriptional activator HAC1
VERVLRNRRAAQSSRERKRLEVEALEIRNQELEAELLRVSKANYILVEELNNLRRSSGVVSRTSTTLPTPVSFTPELFSSHGGHSLLDQTKSSILDELLKSTSTHTTVNPSSLSPELAPVADEALSKDAETSTLEASAATAAATGASPDVTQQPAALLCPPGLQCQSSDAPAPSALATTVSSSLMSQLSPQLLQLLSSQLQLLAISTSAALSICRRPLTQIAMSSKAGFSLPPSPRILSTIIWMVTMSRRPRTQRSTRSSRRQTPRQSTSTPSTLTTSSMKLQPLPPTTATHPASQASAGLHQAASQPTPRHRPSSPPSSTLRLTTLRKILTSSPHLARPLSDATLEVLRLVSPSEARSRSHRSSAGRHGKADDKSEAGYPKVFPSVLANAGDRLGVGERWRRSGSALPSREVLLTLLWVLRLEERKRSEVQRRTGLAV